MKNIVKKSFYLILTILFVMFIMPMNLNTKVKAESIFNNFSLLDTELKKIASLCQQEQGTAKGAAAEASLMANRYDLYGRSKYSSIYTYIRNCRWWAKAGTYMDKMNATSSVVNEVISVLIDGKRTLPGYVDEHDYIGDISSCSNNGNSFSKKDKSQYIQFVTIIKNTMGSTYTYYCHPDTNSDPFGYTSTSKRNSIGDAYYDFNTKELVNIPPSICTCNEGYAGDYTVITESSNLNIRSGESTSSSVVGQIPKGTTVHVSKGNGTWLYVDDYNGISGHVSAKYMQKKDIVPSVPTGNEMTENEGAGQTLPNGDYYIFSSIHLNYYVDIPGTEAASGNNVNMYTTGEDVMPPACDAWTLVYLGNGFYQIKSKGTNLCLDVSGASLDRGTNVQIWEENGSTAQQWSIIQTDNGYKIQSRCNGYYLDVSGGVLENSTNVQVWEPNDSTAQHYLFIPYGDDTYRTIEDGIYSIQSSLNNKFCIDVSGNAEKNDYKDETNIQLWSTETCDDLFYVKYVSDGYYSINEISSALMFEVWNGNNGKNYMNVNNNIQLYENNNGRGQRWMIKDNGDGTYTIFSKLSGYCVDLSGGICEEGRNIAQYYYNGTTAQKWNFVSVNPTEIVIKNLPEKTEYYIGEEINTKGISIQARYSTGSFRDISREVSYEYDFSKVGKTNVTVCFKTNNVNLTNTYTITVKEFPFKGKGTETDPYLISNKENLETMRDLINSEEYSSSFRSCFYLQTIDIDLGNEKWIPIGKRNFNGQDTDRLFSGHYNGNYHSIAGLNVNETTKYAGLFGSIGIKTAIIENLAVAGNVSSTEISVGGICGEICGKDGIIRNCSFIGDISGGEQAIGGIVGYIWQSGSVIDCYHNGKVSTNKGRLLGGVVGNIHTGSSKDSNNVLIKNCYHVGEISGASEAMGEIAGIISIDESQISSVNIENCYALQGEKSAIGSGKADVQGITLLKPSLMKLTATLLGESYKSNTNENYNNGYPILKWQGLKGDCNDDGEFNVSDVVILQKWILNDNTIFDNWQAADLNNDGLINVIDLCIMKQMVIK